MSEMAFAMAPKNVRTRTVKAVYFIASCRADKKQKLPNAPDVAATPKIDM